MLDAAFMGLLFLIQNLVPFYNYVRLVLFVQFCMAAYQHKPDFYLQYVITKLKSWSICKLFIRTRYQLYQQVLLCRNEAQITWLPVWSVIFIVTYSHTQVCNSLDKAIDNPILPHNHPHFDCQVGHFAVFFLIIIFFF